jgi:hypothetical protein
MDIKELVTEMINQGTPYIDIQNCVDNAIEYQVYNLYIIVGISFPFAALI